MLSNHVIRARIGMGMIQQMVMPHPSTSAHTGSNVSPYVVRLNSTNVNTKINCNIINRIYHTMSR